MIDDETHPEWQAVQRALMDQLAAIALTSPFNQRTIDQLQELCNDATQKARAHGLAFPDMIVVYFRGHNLIRVYDREADHAKRQQYIVQLVRDVPDMRAEEIADGFKRAWPDYDPTAEEKLASLKGPLAFPKGSA